MKKYLLLLVGLTIIACSKDDDTPTQSRTIDPLIVTWTSSYEDLGETYTNKLTVRPNGTLTFLDDYLIRDGMIEEGTVNRTWMNAATNPNFNTTTQNYVFGSENLEIQFNADFTTFYDTDDDGHIFTRQ